MKNYKPFMKKRSMIKRNFMYFLGKLKTYYNNWMKTSIKLNSLYQKNNLRCRIF